MYLSRDIPRLRSALLEHRGNITHAAISLGITKPYAMTLVKNLDLSAWARSLRAESGMPRTGRPKNS